jgi:hypothetical protein
MSNPSTLHINKGVELILRRRNKPDKPKTFELSFGKMLALFRREVHIYFEFSFDITKK